jgi:hypothetical protein
MELIDTSTLLDGLDRGFHLAAIRLSERAVIVLGIFEAIKATGDERAAAEFLEKAIKLDSYKA